MTFITPREKGPVFRANLLGFLRSPEVFLFGWGIDAISRRAMKVQADMNTVLGTPFHGLIDFPKSLLIDLVPIVFPDPNAVIQW